jgi:hypothetical protein
MNCFLNQSTASSSRSTLSLPLTLHTGADALGGAGAGCAPAGDAAVKMQLKSDKRCMNFMGVSLGTVLEPLPGGRGSHVDSSKKLCAFLRCGLAKHQLIHSRCMPRKIANEISAAAPAVI